MILETAANHAKSGQLRKAAEKQRATSKNLQASCSMLHVKVHDSAVRKSLTKDGCLEASAGESWSFNISIKICRLIIDVLFLFS